MDALLCAGSARGSIARMRLASLRAFVPFLVASFAVAQEVPPARATTHVILVTIDGLRWQEVFTGADNAMMNKEDGGVADLLALRKRFWRGEPDARREVLLPFLWTVVAKDGQVFGDPAKGSPAVVTNGHKFSYPGYSELLCGFADPRIDSNNKVPNPNVTVLEWLHGRPGFAGSVAAFSGWDVHASILNRQRSGLFVEVAGEAVTVARTPERAAELQRLFAQLPAMWPGFVFDALTFARCREYVLTKRPRVTYLALGETDEWAHGRRYDCYLQMAHTADAMIRELWELAQAHDDTRGHTSLVITVDHGRGRTERNWTDHDAKVEGAEEVWMAVLGPDTQPLGVRENTPATQSMIAATVAALLGEDYRAAAPNAAPPLPGVLR
jgi:hypothetical protein